jgi:hypothetical protein
MRYLRGDENDPRLRRALLQAAASGWGRHSRLVLPLKVPRLALYRRAIGSPVLAGVLVAATSGGTWRWRDNAAMSLQPEILGPWRAPPSRRGRAVAALLSGRDRAVIGRRAVRQMLAGEVANVTASPDTLRGYFNQLSHGLRSVRFMTGICSSFCAPGGSPVVGVGLTGTSPSPPRRPP